jgi:Protein of unknown function (DUF1569)
MEVKNIFNASVKKEIIDRINNIAPETKRKWGKMDAAQMFAHCRFPLQVVMGQRNLKSNIIQKLIFPLFKSILYNDKPYKQGLPTDKSYITTGTSKDFEEEKQNLIEQLNSFSETSAVVEKHPVFGKLSKEQWSKATWKHLDHHLKQFGV